MPIDKRFPAGLDVCTDQVWSALDDASPLVSTILPSSFIDPRQGLQVVGSNVLDARLVGLLSFQSHHQRQSYSIPLYCVFRYEGVLFNFSTLLDDSTQAYMLQVQTLLIAMPGEDRFPIGISVV